MTPLGTIALIAGALSLLRYLVALPILVRWLRRGTVRSMPAGATPPITLLKPLYGADRDLEANLEATLRQNYPAFEVLFLHEREHDPALAAVEIARARVPDVPVRVLQGRDSQATNPKAAVLIEGERAARFAILAAAESDVRPDPLYLRDIANALADADAVSFAPLLFGAQRLPARLAAFAINTDGLLGVLLGRGRLMTGSTVGVRREALDAIGGWAAVGDRIADDITLGRALRHAGSRVVLARRAARVLAPDGGWASTAGWMTRWARTLRVAHPPLYVASLPFVFAPLLLLLAIATGPAAGHGWLLAGIAAARIGTAVAIELRYIWDGSLLRTIVYLPLLWILEPCGFIAGLLGRTINWRGRRYRLKGDRATLVAE